MRPVTAHRVAAQGLVLAAAAPSSADGAKQVPPLSQFPTCTSGPEANECVTGGSVRVMFTRPYWRRPRAEAVRIRAGRGASLQGRVLSFGVRPTGSATRLLDATPAPLGGTAVTIRDVPLRRPSWSFGAVLDDLRPPRHVADVDLELQVRPKPTCL